MAKNQLIFRPLVGSTSPSCKQTNNKVKNEQFMCNFEFLSCFFKQYSNKCLLFYCLDNSYKMEAEFGKMTVTQLKIELGKRRAKVTGRKKELIARLLAYEENQNFQSTNSIDIPDIIPMPAWPSNLFTSITESCHSEMPPIRIEHINQYVLFRQVSDLSSSEDRNSLKKGALMAKDNVVAISYFSENSQDHVFFTGLVSASMKKQVQYSIKFILKGSNGEILNLHCECPSGIGPHSTCKHIIAALMMLNNFVISNKLNIQNCCTSGTI